METWFIIVNIGLASCIPIVIVGGLLNRSHNLRVRQKAGGIGWQFIRYTVLMSSIPAILVLALNDLLTSEAATLLAAFAGFAFGRKGDDG